MARVVATRDLMHEVLAVTNNPGDVLREEEVKGGRRGERCVKTLFELQARERSMCDDDALWYQTTQTERLVKIYDLLYRRSPRRSNV